MPANPPFPTLVGQVQCCKSSRDGWKASLVEFGTANMCRAPVKLVPFLIFEFIYLAVPAGILCSSPCSQRDTFITVLSSFVFFMAGLTGMLTLACFTCLLPLVSNVVTAIASCSYYRGTLGSVDSLWECRPHQVMHKGWVTPLLTKFLKILCIFELYQHVLYHWMHDLMQNAMKPVAYLGHMAPGRSHKFSETPIHLNFN